MRLCQGLLRLRVLKFAGEVLARQKVLWAPYQGQELQVLVGSGFPGSGYSRVKSFCCIRAILAQGTMNKKPVKPEAV